MSKPLDLTQELNDIKARLETLEQRILSLNTPPTFTKPYRVSASPYDASKGGAKLFKGCER